MTFHQDIDTIRAGMAGHGTTEGAGDTREGRRVVDALATQFNTHIGPSVICLPMADSARDAVHGSGDLPDACVSQ